MTESYFDVAVGPRCHGRQLADLVTDGHTALPISAFSFAALIRRAKAINETA